MFIKINKKEEKLFKLNNYITDIIPFILQETTKALAFVMINAPGNTNVIDVSGELRKSDITIKLREKKFRRFKNFIEIVGYCITLPTLIGNNEATREGTKSPTANHDSNNTTRAITTSTMPSSISTVSTETQSTTPGSTRTTQQKPTSTGASATSTSQSMSSASTPTQSDTPGTTRTTTTKPTPSDSTL